MSRIIEELEDFLEMQGFERGTPEFASELRREQVIRCMANQEVSSCTECTLFTYCNIRLAYWRDKALGPEYVDEDNAETVGVPKEDLPEED